MGLTTWLVIGGLALALAAFLAYRFATPVARKLILVLTFGLLGRSTIEPVRPGFPSYPDRPRDHREEEVEEAEKPPAREEETHRPEEAEEDEAPQYSEPTEATPRDRPVTPRRRPRRQDAVPDQESMERYVRLGMQLLISFVGLAIFVMVVFDGCYDWLGWCDKPAGSTAENLASGIVGSVVGFWLTKA